MSLHLNEWQRVANYLNFHDLLKCCYLDRSSYEKIRRLARFKKIRAAIYHHWSKLNYKWMIQFALIHQLEHWWYYQEKLHLLEQNDINYAILKHGLHSKYKEKLIIEKPHASFCISLMYLCYYGDNALCHQYGTEFDTPPSNAILRKILKLDLLLKVTDNSLLFQKVAKLYRLIASSTYSSFYFVLLILRSLYLNNLSIATLCLGYMRESRQYQFLEYRLTYSPFFAQAIGYSLHISSFFSFKYHNVLYLIAKQPLMAKTMRETFSSIGAVATIEVLDLYVHLRDGTPIPYKPHNPSALAYWHSTQSDWESQPIEKNLLCFYSGKLSQMDDVTFVDNYRQAALVMASLSFLNHTKTIRKMKEKFRMQLFSNPLHLSFPTEFLFMECIREGKLDHPIQIAHRTLQQFESMGKVNMNLLFIRTPERDVLNFIFQSHTEFSSRCFYLWLLDQVLRTKVVLTALCQPENHLYAIWQRLVDKVQRKNGWKC